MDSVKVDLKPIEKAMRSITVLSFFQSFFVNIFSNKLTQWKKAQIFCSLLPRREDSIPGWSHLLVSTKIQVLMNFFDKIYLIFYQISKNS